MMKKIGIVTWYWGNYGSILQAYALQQYFIHAGYNCEVINHHVNGDLYTQIRYRITHDGFIPFLNAIKKKIDSKIWGFVEKENRETRSKAFDRFVKKNIVLSSKHYTNQNYHTCLDYEVYVCGSDQIWNPSFTFLSPFYWLSFLPEGKERIAYAPSMGTAILNDDDKCIIRKNLLAFKAISIREKNSGELLELLDPMIKVEHVSDPTMLHDVEFWKEKVKKNYSSRKYLFAYLIKGNNAQREYISKIASDNNLELVVYPYLENHYINKNERRWGDCRCFDDDPFDFLTKIYNADLIITDSFHCIVFSLLFHKDFYALKKCGDVTSQFNRIDQLMNTCGVQDRIITEEMKFRRIPCEYAQSDSAISKLRDKSRAYLDGALS